MLRLCTSRAPRLVLRSGELRLKHLICNARDVKLHMDHVVIVLDQCAISGVVTTSQCTPVSLQNFMIS